MRQYVRGPGLVIEQVKRHAAAPEFLQITGDLRVLPRPVALQRDDLMFGEGMPYRGAVERRVLVDQAGEAPGGGEVDENRSALAGKGLETRQAERFVIEPALRGRLFRPGDRGGRGDREEQRRRRNHRGEPDPNTAHRGTGEAGWGGHP